MWSSALLTLPLHYLPASSQPGFLGSVQDGIVCNRHIGLCGLPPGHQGSVILDQSYSHSFRWFARRCTQGNHVLNKQHLLGNLLKNMQLCDLSLHGRGNSETCRKQHGHDKMMLQWCPLYYLLAESDGKQQNSRDSTSGPHGDAQQTHSECLDPNSEPSRSVLYCGQTTFSHYGHLADNR